MKSKSFPLLSIWLALACVALTTPARAQNTAPGGPTNVQAAAGNAQAAVSFTAPVSNGGSAITGYTVTSFPGGITGTGTGSPVIVQGLINGEPYTFEVAATNAIGTGPESAASNSVTPSATCLANLAGDWNLNHFVTGPGAPWWERDTMTVNPNGTVSVSGTDSSGRATTYSGALWVFPYGMWPMLGSNPDPGILCQVDVDNTLFTCMESWSDGAAQFIAGTQKGASYSTNDLAGNWEGNFLFSGPTNGWVSVSEAIGPGGAFTGTQTPSDGSSGSIAGALSISSAGVVTCTSGSCVDPTFESFLDPGNTIMFGTSGAATEADDGELMVFTKLASSYSLVDLVGYWEGNQLSTNGQWVRMSLQIGADGTFAESDVSSDGTTDSESGSLSISSLPAGVVTCSPGCGENGAISQLVMDAGKTLMVATQTEGAGAYSITILTKTAEAPGVPTNVRAIAGNLQATVTFTAPASNGGSPITSYTVTSTSGQTAIGTSSPITVTGLTNGMAYTFTVTATNVAGQGQPSAPSNLVTPATVTVPGSPAIVSVTPGTAQATVSFTLPSNGGSPITSYTATSNPGSIKSSGAGSPILVRGLTNGEPYTFTVTATNAIGTSLPSVPSNPVTPAQLPGEPTGVKATAGNQQATVSFTAPTSNGGSVITSYTVTSSPGGYTASGTSSPITVPSSPDLTNGTAYTFTVTATNAIGTGRPSAASNRVTPATVPGPPASVTETAGRNKGTVVVTFTPPASNGGSPITSYTVTDVSDIGIKKTGKSSPITVTGLTSGISYTFEVTATNVMGSGQPTTSSTPATPSSHVR